MKMKKLCTYAAGVALCALSLQAMADDSSSNTTNMQQNGMMMQQGGMKNGGGQRGQGPGAKMRPYVQACHQSGDASSSACQKLAEFVVNMQVPARNGQQGGNMQQGGMQQAAMMQQGGVQQGDSADPSDSSSTTDMTVS